MGRVRAQGGSSSRSLSESPWRPRRNMSLSVIGKEAVSYFGLDLVLNYCSIEQILSVFWPRYRTLSLISNPLPNTS